MQLLHKEDLLKSLEDEGESSLLISPLLEKDQVGAVSVDIRLGYDFFVSVHTRKPFIELLSDKSSSSHRGISSYFQETRRDFGDKFILYPGQIVVSTSLEYLSLPLDIYADLLTRSSYNRLGIHSNTMVQPGFRGCFPIELYNHGNNAVELIVGSRLFQARFYKSDKSAKYLLDSRKYYGDVRPTVSKADKDKDLEILNKVRNKI